MSVAGLGEHLRRTARALVFLAGASLLGLTGCSRPYGVPYLNTNLVGEAPHGQVFSFQAPDDGTVWVNAGSRGQPQHIVYSGLIDRGAMLTVDAKASQILLDGKPFSATNPTANRANYQIWYQPTRHDLLAP